MASFPEDLAFDPEKCPVGEVPRIPGGHLLTDDTVPETPPDIPDCTNFDIPPLPPEAPCPTLNDPTVEFKYGGTPEANPPTLEFTIKPGKCCDFDFDLKLHIPDAGTGSCPVMIPDAKTPGVVTGPSFANNSGTLTFQFVPDPDPTKCGFALQQAVDLPCALMTPPAAAPGKLYVKTLTGPATYAGDYGFVHDPSGTGKGCDNRLDIGTITIPDGSCPAITGSSGKAYYGSGTLGPTGSVTVTATPGADCSYVIGADVQLPCPTLVEAPSPGAAYYDNPATYVTIVPDSLSDCGHRISVEVGLPAPVFVNEALQVVVCGAPGDPGHFGVEVNPWPGVPGKFSVDTTLSVPGYYFTFAATTVPVGGSKFLVSTNVVQGGGTYGCEVGFSLIIGVPTIWTGSLSSDSDCPCVCVDVVHLVYEDNYNPTAGWFARRVKGTGGVSTLVEDIPLVEYPVVYEHAGKTPTLIDNDGAPPSHRLPLFIDADGTYFIVDAGGTSTTIGKKCSATHQVLVNISDGTCSPDGKSVTFTRTYEDLQVCVDFDKHIVYFGKAPQ